MIDWRNACVQPGDSIHSVLSVINDTALKVALVVDDELTLLGIVSDGDIRRAMLNNISMHVEVARIMSQKPITVTEADSREFITDLMTRYKLVAIPKVNAKNQLCGLVSVHDLFYKKKLETPVLLMAGGLGVRLRPLTNNCPKPLLKVGEQPILETTLKNFANAGFKQFYISTHYMADKIRGFFGSGEKWDVVIKYLHESNPLGTAGALSLLPQGAISTDIIVMNGDILTNVDFEEVLTFHNEKGADATMCVREYVSQIPYGVIETHGNAIQTIREKPVYNYSVNAGIYVLSAKVVNELIDANKLDMTTLFEECIKRQWNVQAYKIKDYWLDIGRIDDFNQAQLDIKAL